jgi:hypothetical protein
LQYGFHRFSSLVPLLARQQILEHTKPMIKLFARIWAKHSYVFQLEHEAARTEINARLAENLAAERRQNVTKLRAEADEVESKLNKEADELDARIKEYSAKEEAGFWLCENGHEHQLGLPDPAKPDFPCPDCGKPSKFVKRDQMTGQEQYESDKERRDAEKMLAEKRAAAKTESASRRAAAKDEEDKAEGGEQTAKVFRANAANARTVAGKIRAL